MEGVASRRAHCGVIGDVFVGVIGDVFVGVIGDVLVGVIGDVLVGVIGDVFGAAFAAVVVGAQHEQRAPQVRALVQGAAEEFAHAAQAQAVGEGGDVLDEGADEGFVVEHAGEGGGGLVERWWEESGREVVLRH